MFLKRTRFKRPKPECDWRATIMTGFFVIGSGILVGLELRHVL